MQVVTEPKYTNPFRARRANTFGGFIIMRREMLGMTRYQLAAKLGWPDRSLVGRYETGLQVPKGARLQQLALLFGTSITELRKFIALDVEILETHSEYDRRFDQ